MLHPVVINDLRISYKYKWECVYCWNDWYAGYKCEFVIWRYLY